MLGFLFTMWRNLCASLLYFVVRVRCRRQKKFTFAISSLDELLVSDMSLMAIFAQVTENECVINQSINHLFVKHKQPGQ